VQSFVARSTNKEFKKRDITLVDMSNSAINLTLWGDDAVNFDGHVQPVILVKGTRINEFNGGKRSPWDISEKSSSSSSIAGS